MKEAGDCIPPVGGDGGGGGRWQHHPAVLPGKPKREGALAPEHVGRLKEPAVDAGVFIGCVVV
jgi:hypothetical protein